jgi:hypothetical protein
LTTVELEKKDKKMFQLPPDELVRIEKILKKAVDKESGKLSESDLTEDNPDGRKSTSFIQKKTFAAISVKVEGCKVSTKVNFYTEKNICGNFRQS